MTAIATPTPLASPAASLEPLKALIASDILAVNARIIEVIQHDIPLIEQLSRHIVSSGGKRLRPSLTLACAKLCGYDGARHINLATSIEFIHTATLLHDDVVDESDRRRGEDTANVIWGNSASVLVGDYLLSRAFQMMVEDGSLEVLRILSTASAIIAQGEVQQLVVMGQPEIEFAQYLNVVIDKTAALFAAACELGAVVADKDEASCAALRDFGMNLGIAFQLVDDSLDYVSEDDAFGKSVGDDFRERKVTMPVIVAYAAGDAKEKAFWDRTIGEGDQREEDLAQAMAYIASHNAVALTMEKAQSYVELAKASLNAMPDNDAKIALIETAEFCTARVY